MIRKPDIQIGSNWWISLGFHIDHTDPSITLHLPVIIVALGNLKQPGFKYSLWRTVVAMRENANIWKNLIGRDYVGRWKLIAFFQQGKHKDGYFWQDSFLTFFNRLIGCKLLGHRNVKIILDNDDNSVYHCFSCYRIVENFFTASCPRCKLTSNWPINEKKQEYYIDCPHCGFSRMKRIIT